jgi:DNA polymerase-3 subunit delta'
MIDITTLPATSVPLPWHNNEWAELGAALRSDKLPHAVLFVGGRHTGKQQLALALARLLLCTQPDNGFNCGKCHPCELSARGSHGDFLWLAPQEKSRSIKIDQIRELVKFTTKTASFGTRKVAVLTPAENMNLNAFNALLKSLEEPASDTHIMLLCHRLSGVPATIRSRCQIRRLATPDTETSLAWLDKNAGSRKENQGLLALADGRPLLALQLFTQGDAEAFAQRHRALVALATNQITVPQAAALWKDVEAELFLEQFASFLQQVLIATPTTYTVHQSTTAAFYLLDEVNRLLLALRAGANPNRQLMVDVLLAKLHTQLGNSQLGDNIPAQLREIGV